MAIATKTTSPLSCTPFSLEMMSMYKKMKASTELTNNLNYI